VKDHREKLENADMFGGKTGQLKRIHLCPFSQVECQGLTSAQFTCKHCCEEPVGRYSFLHLYFEQDFTPSGTWFSPS
jgi:hypothetical protein